MTSRADVLAAASLLLAIIVAFFSLWYEEISRVLAAQIPAQFDDRGEVRDGTRKAFRSRALPLALTSLLLAAVFLPEGLHITIHWFRTAAEHGLWTAIVAYDPVSLSLVVVAAGLAALALYTVWLAGQLVSRRKKIDRPQEPLPAAQG